MRALGVADAFHTHVPVPALSRVEAEKVLAATGAFGEDDGEKAAEFLSSSTPIKVLLRAVSLAQALERDEDALSRAAAASTQGGFFSSSGLTEKRKSVGLDPTGEAWTTALRRVNLTGAEDDGLGGCCGDFFFSEETVGTADCRAFPFERATNTRLLLAFHRAR